VGFNVKQLSKPFIAALLLIATIFTATGHLDRMINSVGLERLARSNDQYLEESFNRSLKGFLLLSTIKSGVAVLEGSEVGVGFNLEVGDIVQSIYDYVDVAWRTALAGGTILLLTKIVLQTIQAIDDGFLFGSLLLCLMTFLLSWFLPQREKLHRLLKELMLFLISITVALYLILPISISGASYLSAKITRPLIEEAQSGFESIEKDFTPQSLNERFFPKEQEEDSLWSRLDFRAKLENSRQAIMSMALWLKEITRDFAVWTIKLVAGYLFDCVIFPLAFFIVVYILTKAFLSHFLGVSRQQNMREDMEAVLKSYYHRETKPL